MSEKERLTHEAWAAYLKVQTPAWETYWKRVAEIELMAEPSCICKGANINNDGREWGAISEWQIKNGFLEVNEEYRIEINYCPICGRKLKDGRAEK